MYQNMVAYIHKQKKGEYIMLTLNTKQKEFVDAAKKMYNKSTLNNNELKKVAKSLGMNFNTMVE